MQTKKQEMQSRWTALQSERSSWIEHWRECQALVNPRSGRFFLTDVNKGTRRNKKIYDSTATQALNVLAAGMMSGATSPARPWFRLATPDSALMNSYAVKEWLAKVTVLILRAIAKSNTYNALHQTYYNLGVYGTHASIVMDDFETILHHYPLCAGEYALASDYKGTVNTLYREFNKTVASIVMEFGYEKCSRTVQNLYNKKNYDAYVPVMHAIQPNKKRDVTYKDSKNKRFSSCYWEAGKNNEMYLREAGFDAFPALCPRWDLTSGDVYGQSPAMTCLPDIKQLQHQQFNKAQAIELQVRPPLVMPTSFQNARAEANAGGITFANGQTDTIRSMYDVRLDLSHLREDIMDVRERIRDGFYADLFLMLANSDNSQMTATEVAERHEEKMTMLGPVIESLHTELLEPLVEMTFDKLLVAGLLPPPPEELQGEDLNVEFVSMLAQAQRSIATNGIDRFVSALGMVAQVKPDVLDKFNADNWADNYSDMLGVDPDLIVSNEDVAIVRQARADQAQQQQQMQAMEQMANTANTMASTDTAGQNALTDVTKQFTGYT